MDTKTFTKNLREVFSEGIDTHGLLTVFKKELADHFSSYRFVILFALIAMVSLISTYMTGVSLREELEGIAKPKLVFLMLFTSGSISLDWFVAFLFPLIGIVLGFDSINREISTGTMSKLVSQPIFRDSIINGKFLAGITTIAIMLVSIVLVISGLGLRVLGVVPGIEEVMADHHLPGHQYHLCLLLVGNSHAVVHRLPQHCHIGPGIDSYLGILLLFHHNRTRHLGQSLCTHQPGRNRASSEHAQARTDQRRGEGFLAHGTL